MLDRNDPTYATTTASLQDRVQRLRNQLGQVNVTRNKQATIETKMAWQDWGQFRNNWNNWSNTGSWHNF
jgi:hypothetical protein